MLKFARKNRSSSVDRTSVASLSPQIISSPSPKKKSGYNPGNGATVARKNLSLDERDPTRALSSLNNNNVGPCVDEVDAAKQSGRISVRLLIQQSEHAEKQKQLHSAAGSGDYETVYSGTFCRQNSNSSSENSEANTKATPLAAPSSQPQHQRSLTIQSATATTVTQMNEVQRSALKKNLLLQQASMSAASGESSHNPGYDFHRAIERLVEKMDLGLQLDTSSESGYGSDQDSLKSQQEQQSSPTGAQGGSQVGGAPPLLPPRASPAPQQPALPPRLEKTAKKRVQFDSYVLFLQGLRERDLEMVQIHIKEVCDAALATDEVVAELMSSVIEGCEPIVRELLANGFDANLGGNAGATHSEMTPLHLAAAFNNLPLVRMLLSYGAAVFARAHSSGKLASELCSRQLPGYQACHAYLRCMEECLGVANGGRVYAAQSHRTGRSDELALNAGEELVVVRKGDYNGSAWWWCSNSKGEQGYVLQDFLALNSTLRNN